MIRKFVSGVGLIGKDKMGKEMLLRNLKKVIENPNLDISISQIHDRARHISMAGQQ